MSNMSTSIIQPKYVLTADDERGLLVVNGAIALAFVWTAFLTRVFQRLRLREWNPEDWLLTTAIAFETIHSGITFHLVDLGLGIPPQGIAADQLRRLSKGALAAQLIYVLTLFASKCSVVCLYLRLSPTRAVGVAVWALGTVCTVWVIVAVILITAPCNSLQSYTDQKICSSTWLKWQVITSLDIITEALIFAIAMQLLWRLELQFRAKFTAVLAFAARLPVIAAAYLRLYLLHKQITGESYRSNYMIATQWQLGLTIMASVVTGLGPFLRPFSKEYATEHQQTSEYGQLSKKSIKDSLKGSLFLRGPPVQSSHSARSQNYLMQTLPAREDQHIADEEPRVHNGDAWAEHPTTT